MGGLYVSCSPVALWMKKLSTSLRWYGNPPEEQMEEQQSRSMDLEVGNFGGREACNKPAEGQFEVMGKVPVGLYHAT